MRISFLLVFLSIVTGGVVGATLGYRTYGVPKNEFGPYLLDRAVSSQDVDQYWSGDAPTSESAKAEIVGGNTFDFGVMRRNATATHQFVVKNIGEGELTLVVAGSTCKCTVGTLQDAGIGPGESTVIDMEWSAKTNARMFSQSATLKTNDPTQGEIALIVQGAVVDMVAAEPTAWNRGDIATSASMELKASLYNYAKEPMEIVQIRWMDEVFQSRSETKIERRAMDPERDGVHVDASEVFDLVVNIGPGSPQGLLQQTLRIEYRSKGDEENHPPLEMVLTGRVVGALSVMGGPRLAGNDSGTYRLNLGELATGKGAEEKIHILFRGPLKDVAKLRVASVVPEVALEAVLGEPQDRGTMKIYPLIVRVKETAPEMQLSGSSKEDIGIITIESDDPEVAPVRVGVVFRISNS